MRTERDSASACLWAAPGLEGVARSDSIRKPTLHIGERGHSAFRLNTSSDLLLRQQMVLQPQIDRHRLLAGVRMGF